MGDLKMTQPFFPNYIFFWYMPKDIWETFKIFHSNQNKKLIQQILLYGYTISNQNFLIVMRPFGWGCRIHWLYYYSKVRHIHTHNECRRYVTKQLDGEGAVILKLWVMRSTLLLPSLPGPLPDRVLYMGQIKLLSI